MRRLPPDSSSTCFTKYSTAGVKSSSPLVLASRSTTGEPEPPALSLPASLPPQAAMASAAVAARTGVASRIRFVVTFMVSLLSARIETTVRAVRAGYIVAGPRVDCGQQQSPGGDGCHNRGVAHGPVRRANIARLAAGTVALAYGLGALAVARGPGELTTYAGRSDVAAAFAVVAGIALVGAGVVMSFARPDGRIGDLALVAGLVWFAPFWAGWKGGPPLVLTVGTLAAGFAFPLFVHLVVAHPSGRLRSKGARAFVVAVYVEAVLS